MPKILHFEDDTFLRDMYETKFGMLGFEYSGLDSPSKDPVSVVLQENPDLIIMDILMPLLDGFEATRLLKADPRTKDIPIIGLCNLGQAPDIQKALELGMTDYLVTAVHLPSEIVTKVRQTLKMPIPAGEKPISDHVAEDTLRRIVLEPETSNPIEPSLKRQTWWQKLFS